MNNELSNELDKSVEKTWSNIQMRIKENIEKYELFLKVREVLIPHVGKKITKRFESIVMNKMEGYFAKVLKQYGMFYLSIYKSREKYLELLLGYETHPYLEIDTDFTYTDDYRTPSDKERKFDDFNTSIHYLKLKTNELESIEKEKIRFIIEKQYEIKQLANEHNKMIKEFGKVYENLSYYDV